MKNKNQNTRNSSSPFIVHSILGFNVKVPIVNLTNAEEKPKVAYASGHIVTILDCETKATEHILGHERDIVSIKTAETCQLLVTSDKYLVNIWDRQVERTVLLKTFNDPLKGEPILSTGFSLDGEYLALVSPRFLQLWIWRNGSDKPDALRELPDNFRIGSRIIFCKSNTNSGCFVVPTVKNLIFCRWNVQKRLLEMHTPKQFPGVRDIIDSSYCTNYCKGVSIANKSIIVWSDTPPSKDFRFDLFENRMEFQYKMKLGFYQLKTVSCWQGFIIIGDAKGEVKFYDENMKFCFLYDLCGQRVQSTSFIYRAMETTNKHCEANGKVDPQCRIGMFFVCCENGNTYKCKVNMKPTLICESIRTFMTCFDTHPKLEILCGGRDDGNIFLYDYAKNTYDKFLLLSSTLPKNFKKSQSDHLAATCLKFSSCGRYVAAGTNNGHISIVKTLTFKPFQKAIQLADTDIHIEKVIFSKSNEFIVYHDTNCTVGLLYFESSSWKLLRKCRVHDSQIVHMSLRETDDGIGLITISDDYRIAKYTIRSARSDNVVGLLMNSCKRLDFLSVLKCCIPLQQKIMSFPNENCGNDQAFLTTDEKFKFQIRHFESFEMIHTFAAPITENKPITLMCHVNLKNEHAVVYANKNIIGLHHLPIDGNPKKYLAMVGHPRKILDMKVSYCNKYLFTIGKDDPTVYIWEIQMPVLIKQYKSGGTSLKPFCNLIPDGVSGQLFQEMQDNFFYMQIRRQKEHSNELQEYQLIDGIPALDAIDFMRSIGFFPSEAKIEYIMEEIKYYTNDSSMITFENLMKLFVNYKPPFGYLKSDIHQTLKHLGYSYTMQSADVEITRDRLVEIFTSLGEEMDENDAAIYLNRLDGQCENVEESDPLDFNNIRSVYTIPEFLKYILGVE